MKYIFGIVVALLFVLPTQAFAGAESSGGGMGVVCKNANGTIKSVELLDLWEARVIYGRVPKPSNLSVADQVKGAINDLKNSLYSDGLCIGSGIGPGYCNGITGPAALYEILTDDAEPFLAPNSAEVHRLRGVNLKKTNDAYEVVTPRDCEIEQLVRYTDTASGGDILINQDLVDHLNKTNLAALYVHEALYAYLRQGGMEKSSLRVRRAVGLAFSGYQFRPLDSFLPKKFYVCSTNKWPVATVLVYAPTSGICAGDTTFQIVDIDGRDRFDFSEPGGCLGMSPDQLFKGPIPLWIDTPLSSKVGFDYTVFGSIGGDENGPMRGTLQLTAAPDQSKSGVMHLGCEMKNKGQYPW